MKHEAFARAFGNGVNFLLVFADSECENAERLGFTACENSRSVGHRKNAEVNSDRSDRSEVTAVDSSVFGDDLMSHRIFEVIVEEGFRTGDDGLRLVNVHEVRTFFDFFGYSFYKFSLCFVKKSISFELFSR